MADIPKYTHFDLSKIGNYFFVVESLTVSKVNTDTVHIQVQSYPTDISLFQKYGVGYPCNTQPSFNITEDNKVIYKCDLINVSDIESHIVKLCSFVISHTSVLYKDWVFPFSWLHSFEVKSYELRSNCLSN